MEEKLEPEYDIAEPGEEISALGPEAAAAVEALSTQEDQLDLDFESDEISQQADALAAASGDESLPEHEIASLSEEQLEKDEPVTDALQPEPESVESLAVSPELIAATVERVLNEKYSAKIEKIIYEVIEKVVSKEIDRLKGVLLEKSSLDDS